MNLNILIPIFTIVLLAVLNCPLWVALIGGVFPYFLFLQSDIPIQIIAQRLVAITENQSYLAIPFFITAGCIMNYSGISKRLMDLADGLVGHKRGGLGHVNVVLSTLMGGISGSAAADAAMECKILVPEMERRGYNREYSAAVTLASSLITPIIPPGMGLIIFAFVTQISVGRLLCAGYIPGLICMVLMLVYVSWYSKKHNYSRSRERMLSVGKLVKLTVKGIWALLMPFGIILALRFGVFTATEAGAICAVYAIIIGVFVYKELKWKHVWPIIEESVIGTATVMILVCAANLLSYYLTYERIPQALSDSIISMNLNKYTFLLVVNVLLLLIGMFMEGGAPVLILGPLLMPIALSLGINPIHFGLVFIFNIGIGNMSPPFGVVLYQVAGLANVSLNKLIIQIIPFLLIMIFVLLLVTFIPELSLLIPNLVYGN